MKKKRAKFSNILLLLSSRNGYYALTSILILSTGFVIVSLLKFKNILSNENDNFVLFLVGSLIGISLVMVFLLRNVLNRSDRIMANYRDYIVVEMPDNVKAMFADLLIGFEQYARLKGYKVSISIDNSAKDKIAFKFTLDEEYNNVERENIRKDIKEYIEKVKQQDSFEDMPTILTQSEHSLVLTTLKNRLTAIHNNYILEKSAREIEKNNAEFYKKIAEQLAQGKGVSSTPSIFIQTGGNHTPHNVHAVNSKAIGENITFEDVSDNSTKITISNSFNTKREQISKIDEIVKQLRELNDNSFETRQDIITGFSMIKDEISHAESPDKSKVHRWLSDIKSKAETLVFGHELSQAIQWIFDSFKFVG